MQDDKTKPSYVIHVLRKENQDLKKTLRKSRKFLKKNCKVL